MKDFDQTIMRRALALAKKGQGRVEPNPMVGCVIVRNGRVIGEGFHRRFGGPHAEIDALRRCTASPRGATVYVTLEPCCHFGKTPPCTKALIEVGIAEVVIPLVDPNPAVAGRGIRELKRAGVRVRTGVCKGEAAEVLAPFLTTTCLKRPYVIAKWAQTLDGQLVTPPGESRWISCPDSRREVHRLRARVDAILVGIGTVLADDPMLNAREVPVRRLATRVVLDARLRISKFSRLAATTKAIPTVVFTARANLRSRKAQALQRLGVELRPCRSRAGLLDPTCVLEQLASRRVTNLLVEGGPRVLSSFIRAGLVDEALAFVAPRCDNRRLNAPEATIQATLRPLRVTVSASGNDAMLRMRLTRPPRVRG